MKLPVKDYGRYFEISQQSTYNVRAKNVCKLCKNYFLPNCIVVK